MLFVAKDMGSNPRLRIQSRWHAFLIHLALSAAIFVGLAAVIYFWWFPGALFSAAGGSNGMKIVAGVDLVLGPLLTLVVYKVSKPVSELLRDLSIIAMLQVTCLLVGMVIVFQARPVALVYVYDTFYALQSQSFADAGIDVSILHNFEAHSPVVLYADVPTEKADFLSLHVKSLLEGGQPLQLRTDLYREMPTDSGGREALFKHVVAADDQIGNYSECIRVQIETGFNQGSICFDPLTQQFSDFRPNG